MAAMDPSRSPLPPRELDAAADLSAVSHGRREKLVSMFGLVVVAAILVLGFAAYFSPGLMLGIENLRLCF